MKPLIARLSDGSRRERSTITQVIQGGKPEASAAFRTALRLPPGYSVPPDVFWATDYQFDNIGSALGIKEDRGSPQEADVLLAWEHGPTTVIAMMDCKDQSYWDNAQIDRMVARIKAIFGEDGRRYPRVVPLFLLMSDIRPRRVETGKWPAWVLDEHGDPYWTDTAPLIVRP